MKIEILYPEICNLYGDLANVTYIEKQFPTAKIYKTSILDTPKFINSKNNISLVYIGSSTENYQRIIIDALKPYKENIINYINDGHILIATGNALSIFGKQIVGDTNIECLNIFDFKTEENLNKRHNSLFLGKFLDIEILGFKSQFNFIYVDKNNNYNFIELEKGVGNSPTSHNEGIKYKNFYGTSLLGPFLILNPYFMKYILKILNQNDTLIYEEAMLDAYQYRLKELHDPKTVFTSKHE